jgi:Periplasmic copper-binding protein (NosD)
VSNNAGANMIGGTTAGARNVISGNDCAGDPEKIGHGVEFLGGAGGNTVAGNYIGTDATGSAALHNCYGVFVSSGGSQTIGVPGAGNVISGNSGGVVIRQNLLSAGNVVQANYIGTDASGSAKISQGVGICVCPPKFRRADRNTIGGTAAATRNVISGNGTGVALSKTYRNTISGNYIGTDATGTAPLGNSTGVSMYQVGESTIGGNAAGARNVISANSSRAVSMSRVDYNDVTGNYIGTDVTGSADLGNGAGVTIQTDQFGGAGGNDIGRNVISGNTGYGVTFDGSQSGEVFFGNAVYGNYIGTNAAGNAALPNGGGVHFLEGPYFSGNAIGGTGAGQRNVISGNAGWGVVISENSLYVEPGVHSSNYVNGNYIGTKAGGGHALGNAGGGVKLELGAQDESIKENKVAFNGGPGVVVDGTPDDNLFVASRNSILGNSIYNNNGLGIDLLNGGNNDQAASKITAVTTGGGSTTIDGTLDSTPSTSFRIELFSSPTCDSSGAGEGKTFLGFTDATTDGAGHATFSSSVPALPADQAVTATATSAAGDTSEFSTCFTSP